MHKESSLKKGRIQARSRRLKINLCKSSIMISVGKKIIKLGPSAALYENGSYQGKTFNKIVNMKLSYIPVHEAPKAFFKLPKPSIVD